MGTLGSTGLAKHESRVGAGGVSRYPGGDVAGRDGLDSQVQTSKFVDRTVINFIAFLGPCSSQKAIIRVKKVRLC